MATIIAEAPEHAGAIDHLLDLSFGPGRFAKTAYRLREGVDPIADLSYVAMDLRDGLIGSLRFWPVRIADQHLAIMLGPLAVDPAHRSTGVGMSLMITALGKAAYLGHRICVLVGDEPYYARIGFSRASALGLTFPGPVDPARLLARELVPGAMDGVHGLIHRVPPDDPVSAHSTPLAPPGK